MRTLSYPKSMDSTYYLYLESRQIAVYSVRWWLVGLELSTASMRLNTAMEELNDAPEAESGGILFNTLIIPGLTNSLLAD